MNQSLKKIIAQFQEIWKQLGVSQKISVAVATLAVFGGLIGLSVWSSKAQYSLLYGRLSDSEASKVIAALDDSKTPYKIGAGGGTIMVPSEKVHFVRMQLAGRGIPKGEGVGFEIFDKPNFGMSDFMQRANYMRAVQGELSRTISQLDEVEYAHVAVTMPENRLLLNKDQHPTAAVLVRVRGNAQLPKSAVNSIRFLVANSVEGLKPQYVSVTDTQGNSWSEGNENDGLGGSLGGSQLTIKRDWEQYLSQKAESLLAQVLGPGQAIVRVNAEINADTLQKVEKKYDGENPVIRKQTKNDEKQDSLTSAGQNPVGLSANQPPEATNLLAGASPVTNTKNVKTLVDVENAIGEITSTLTQSAGGIKRLTASVMLAAKTEATNGVRKVNSRSPEELDKIRKVVQNALGIQSENGRTDLVTVEEMPFNDSYANEVSQQITKQQRYNMWLDMGKNGGFLVLGLIVFFILMRSLKKAPTLDIPLGIPVRELTGSHSNGNGNGISLGRMGERRGVITVDVLNQLIKENPGNMTQAIRGWLSKDKTSSN